MPPKNPNNKGRWVLDWTALGQKTTAYIVGGLSVAGGVKMQTEGLEAAPYVFVFGLICLVVGHCTTVWYKVSK